MKHKVYMEFQGIYQPVYSEIWNLLISRRDKLRTYKEDPGITIAIL